MELNPKTEIPALLGLTEVCRIIRRSRASVFRDLAKGTFPRPIHTGQRGRAWLASDLAAWVASRKTAA